MKRKILGIFVCMLLIATALLALGTRVNDNLSIRETYDVHYNLIQQNIGSSCNLGEWLEQIKLTALDGAADDRFGFSVSIDGDYALVGAYGDDDNGVNSGSAYVFKRSGTTWTEEQKLLAPDGAAGDCFGFSVSIDGDYALAGAYNDDSGKGSAYVFKKLIPDLDCLGSLSWTDISPGATVTSSFMVGNVGDPGSELSWEIESYPDWGTWTFIPSSGTGLTPGMGTITISVEVVAPNEKNQDFIGEVKVVNSEYSNDYDTITVSLTTPRNKAFNIFQPFLRFLENHPNLFPVLQYLLRQLN